MNFINLWKFSFREGDLFQWWGCSFYVKNERKSEILNEKKVYKQKCFSLS